MAHHSSSLDCPNRNISLNLENVDKKQGIEYYFLNQSEYYIFERVMINVFFVTKVEKIKRILRDRVIID